MGPMKRGRVCHLTHQQVSCIRTKLFRINHYPLLHQFQPSPYLMMPLCVYLCDEASKAKLSLLPSSSSYHDPTIAALSCPFPFHIYLHLLPTLPLPPLSILLPTSPQIYINYIYTYNCLIKNLNLLEQSQTTLIYLSLSISPYMLCASATLVNC